MEEEKIFEPKGRVLFDILLTTNLGFFILFAIAGFKLSFLLMAGAIINVLVILLWNLFLKPAVTVEIVNNALTGPSGFFKKRTIPFRKIDHKKTADPIPMAFKRWFCKDVWSVEGEHVRLYRKFLGEEKIYKIMAAIYKYPFRDTSSQKSQDK